MPRVIPINSSLKQMSNLQFRLRANLYSHFHNPVKEIKYIPVIINNFNRLAYLKKLLEWLEKSDMRKIYIIDNNSTYKPLLEFYQKVPHTIFKLNKNVGHRSLWQTHIFKKFSNDFYIYSDPDILPSEECPDDWLEHYLEILASYPEISKVGFGLKIDDLPEHYYYKDKVIDWEKKYWQNEIARGVYRAKIDTTFALYRPYHKGGHEIPSLRTGPPYIARHLPWYQDSKKPDDEELFYIKSCDNSSSWYKRTNIYEKA